MVPEPDTVGVVGAPPVPTANRVDYDEIYRLRRRVSTMHQVAVARLVDCVRSWCLEAVPSRPYRILAVGCGDGDLDVEIIEAVAAIGSVDYVGCDINADSLNVFSERIATSPVATQVRLMCVPIDDVPDLGGFDLVLLSHVLYYFADPAGVILDVLDRHCAPDGRVVAVHSGHDGVPAMTERALGMLPFTTAESIVDDLRERGVSPRIHRLATEMRLDDDVLASDPARDLFGFLVERDSLSDEEYSDVVDAMIERSSRVDGSWEMSEEVLVLEIRSRLASASRVSAIPAVDPIRDYHALEEAFDWSRFLGRHSLRNGRASRLLDVGCGTGRWLRVLAAANPELVTTDRTRIAYDRVDPVSQALNANTAIASTMFDLGETWVEVVETADLPSAAYDVIWSVHSLYAQDRDDLTGVMARLVDALAPDGVLIIALGARGSFYIEAKPELTGTDPFVSSDDVVEVADRLGLSYRLHQVDYVERFDLDADEAIRRFVWHESIGNTYVPAGLTGDLPSMPTDKWFEQFRGESWFEFPQRTGVIVIER